MMASSVSGFPWFSHRTMREVDETKTLCRHLDRGDYLTFAEGERRKAFLARARANNPPDLPPQSPVPAA